MLHNSLQKNIITTESNFVTYVRTMMFWNQRFRDIPKDSHVFIPQKDIENRFYPFPQFVAKDEIRMLCDAGDIEVVDNYRSNGQKYFTYRALKSGRICPDLLKPRGRPLDVITEKMMEYLNRIEMLDEYTDNLYYQSFRHLRDRYLRLFFIVDEFSGRVHTPVTSMKGQDRKLIRIDGHKTSSIDVVTMQPLLLGHILRNQIGDNEFSYWISSGRDIYSHLQAKSGLRSRDEAKEKFFQIIFDRPSSGLAKLFGSSHWIEWINEYKSQIEIRNPHTNEKPHSNLAWLLQTTEVKMMRKVWEALIMNQIPFLSVHDEIITPDHYTGFVEAMFKQTIGNDLEGFKIKITH
jgi:hypothetical protein